MDVSDAAAVPKCELLLFVANSRQHRVHTHNKESAFQERWPTQHWIISDTHRNSDGG